MPEQINAVTPEVLKWARTSLGLQTHQVAEEMGKDQDVIERWEQGIEAPTYAQLEKLAYSVFKRPIATFFLPEPPVEEDVRAEFRTYLGNSDNKLVKDTLLAVRDARVRQLYLEEFHDGAVEAPAFLSSVHALLTSTSTIEESAAFVRAQLGVSEEQVALAKNSSESLDIWRAAVERAGVFVFKRAFKQENISGLSLRHPEFPIVYLNNKTSFTRQTFTLVHELGHLALDVSGICSVDLKYTTSLSSPDRKTEEFCDAFAAEVLVPRISFQSFNADPSNQTEITSVAQYYKVSPAVIARKFFDLRMIDRLRFRELMSQYFPDNWRNLSEDDTKSGGGNYYNTQLQYLSKRYLTEAFRKHSRGQISDQTFADYLGVRVSSLAGIESRFISRQEGI